MAIKSLAQELASLLLAIRNCDRAGNAEWADKHASKIDQLCRTHLPHGSGIDGSPATLDLEKSTPDRLVIGPLDFHHMDENGYYDGWTEHTAVVTPSLAFGFSVRITGRNRNDIKTYIGELIQEALGKQLL